ncbi:TetR/AcrR family transcriptional regulator [Actinomyces ruminis]|uniref:TetR/AcrR family transcriptional regulator n=1 Tax=Actinomyces ruminis TaxID=1937003 RepID=A0ABX4ME89_9ACTO|nr:TetR/AcrR family transcriptional regulator [Actinomyces ruminis]PHP53531.1 TetR/AcrR family transcriptional regulator [Actinomyces ruminis]
MPLSSSWAHQQTNSQAAHTGKSSSSAGSRSSRGSNAASIRGPYAKTAGKKRTIAQAAFEIIVEVGHENLTNAAVAERTGLTERTLTYHFPTRDHLLIAAHEYFDSKVATRITPSEKLLWSADDQMTSTQQLEAIVRTLLRSTATSLGYLRLHVYLIGRSQDPASVANEYFHRHYEVTLEGLGRIMLQLQASELARADRDPLDLARQFLASWEGLQQQWVVLEDFDLEEAMLRAFLDVTGHDLQRTRTAVEEVLHTL